MEINEQKANQALQKELSDKAKGDDSKRVVIGSQRAKTVVGNLAVVPSQYKLVSPTELYQRFLVAEPDKKGNYCCGYGEYGRSLAVAATFDFADFVLPKFLSAQVGAEVKVTKAKDVLYMIHRAAPKTLYTPTSNGQLTSTWKTEKPVCFSVLSGLNAALEVKLNGNLEAGKGFSLGGSLSTSVDGNDAEITALGLDLGIRAALTASIGMKGELMHMKADEIGWYPNGTDTKLEKAFTEAIGNPSRKNIKAEAVGWCKYILQYAKSLDKPAKGKTSPSSVLKDLNQKVDLKSQVLVLVKDGVKEAIGTVTDIDIPLIDDLIDFLADKWDPTNKPKLVKLLQEVQTFFETKMLAKQSNLNSPNPTVQSWVSAAPSQIMQDYADLVKQIDYYTNQLNEKPTPTTPTGPVPLEQHLNFVNLYSFTPAAQIKIDGSGKVGFSTDAGGVGGNITGSAQLAGDVKFSTFRYQTCMPSRPVVPRLIMTQDTTVSYLRLQATAEWLANIELGDYGLPKGADCKKTLFDNISYESVIGYWRYPKQSGQTQGKLELGSGISFGCSANIGRLRNIGLGTKSSDKQAQSDQKWIKQLANTLRVTPQQLQNCLDQAFMGAEAKDAIATMYDYCSVILESNYAFTEPVTIALKLKSDGKTYKAPDLTDIPAVKDAITALTNQLKNPGATAPPKTPRLESIRIRVRHEDHLGNYDNSKTIFKLGFDYLAGFKIDYSKIQKASGNAGIIDLCTIWMNPDYQANPADGYEKTVPSTVLVPHSLFNTESPGS